MSSAAGQPRLRLVGPADAQWRDERRAREAVLRENLATSARRDLDPTDARWALAAQTHAQLQGAALTPERRERMLRLAQQLGIRPFDANVIIAIVQDHARRGAPLPDAAPTLAIVPEPRKRAHAWEWMRWIAALGAAIVGTLMLIRWVLG